MNYKACLEYLYAKLPMFSRTGPAALKPDLTNTLQICSYLGNPEARFPTIHVAGTNGKGSVSHMLASILQEAGFKTGLYTSPHLRDFRERIRINGTMIPEKDVVSYTQHLLPVIESISPSFFEVTVGMAFQYFALQKVDIAVIETGLGGRLDSTNVVTPLLSIITNIGFDHVSLLGDSLDKIAFEKAGIIKQGRPAVIGRIQPETLPVFRAKAASMDAPLVFAEEDWSLSAFEMKDRHLEMSFLHKPDRNEIVLACDLTGVYQTENGRTVLSSIGLLKKMGWQISEPAVKLGFSHVKANTGLEGRWQTIRNRPDIVVDVAHNPDGMQQVLHQLEFQPHNRLFMILGLSADKDCNKILDMLPSNATFCFTQANIPRALPGVELAKLALEKGLEGEVFENVNLAIRHTLKWAEPDDLILVCGSVFIAGEVSPDGLSQ